MTNTAIQQYIFDNIDNSGYGGGELSTEKEKLQFLAETFKAEYGWAIARYGVVGALKEWLSGLTSCINVPFYNHDILQKAVSWGLLEKDASEEKQDALINEWFWNFAREIHKLMRQHKIRV